MSNPLYKPLRDGVPPLGTKEPIPEHQWLLRYIKLHPGQSYDDIHCTLCPSTVGEIFDQYEALSYTWGDRSDPHEIQVNDQSFSITRNLEAALRRLRLPDRERILWIDSVCINQTDVSEVNIQVQRMWAIYQHARQVLVFLGEEASNSNLAFDLLSQISYMSESEDAFDCITTLLNDQNMESRWEALLQLLRRPWWSRAWIIQEYVVAKSVVFQCGSIELEGEKLGKALDVMVEYRFRGVVPTRHLYIVRHVPPTPIYHLLTTRRMYHGAATSSINLTALNTLYRFRGSKSYDARDKVFSIYRLIAEHPKLAPDYTKRVQDLFKDVVGAMIESSGTLEVLSHHNRSNKTGLPGLPTWCPDWTVMRGKRILLWPNHYQPTGERDNPKPASARIDGDTLTLKGKLLDRIQWLQAKAFESNDFKDEKYIHTEIKAIEEVVMGATDQNANTADEKVEYAARLDAFRRTLVASRIRKRGPNNEATVLGPSEADELWDAWSSQQEGHVRDNNQEAASWYTEALYNALCGRAFFVSKGGHFGLVDESAQVGDVVGVFVGGRVLLCLHEIMADRERGDSNLPKYELVGECYMHDFMSGRGVSLGLGDISEIELV